MLRIKILNMKLQNLSLMDFIDFLNVFLFSTGINRFDLVNFFYLAASKEFIIKTTFHTYLKLHKMIFLAKRSSVSRKMMFYRLPAAFKQSSTDTLTWKKKSPKLPQLFGGVRRP